MKVTTTSTRSGISSVSWTACYNNGQAIKRSSNKRRRGYSIQKPGRAKRINPASIDLSIYA